MLIRCENYAEEMRLNLAMNPRFSISAAFRVLDIKNNGYITETEIKHYLEDHEFFATQKEIDLLFTKIDKDKD